MPSDKSVKLEKEIQVSKPNSGLFEQMPPTEIYEKSYLKISGSILMLTGLIAFFVYNNSVIGAMSFGIGAFMVLFSFYRDNQLRSKSDA